MNGPALRIEPIATDGDDGAFEALGRRLHGHADPDPVPVDAQRWLAWDECGLRARLSAMRASDLYGAPGVSGLIGHYAAADAEAGVALLRAACAALARRGARQVLGPMNGSTWRRYRLALPARAGDPRFDPPVFLSEPTNPPEYPEHFESAGFAPVDFYESRIETPLRVDEAAQRGSEARLAARGVTVRTLDPARFEEELRGFWELSLASFARNPWYSPIGWEEFLSVYAPLRPRIDPRLVLVAEDARRQRVGFMLGFGDALSDRGRGPTRLVCKTVAVAPEARGQGLGDFLLAEVRRRAAPLGFTAAIDALIHSSNVSGHLSRKHATRLFRRYALYRWSA